MFTYQSLRPFQVALAISCCISFIILIFCISLGSNMAVPMTLLHVRVLKRSVPNMVRAVTFTSHACSIRPITTHRLTGQSEHTKLYRALSFVKNQRVSLKRGKDTNMHDMWKNSVFLLKRVYTLHYTKYTQ